MPSAFRSSRSGRQLDSASRSRGQIDHDVFEGLPVRRWSRQVQTTSQAPKTEESEFSVQGPGGTTALPELAMPRDSQLLPAASRALLRAARAGCIYVRPSGRSVKEEENKMASAEDQANGNANSADRSFTSRKWTVHSKHQEPPEIEFLAKRRPGLPSLYGGPTSLDGGSGATPAMRRTKFQKVDPTTGNISIYEAWVPDGHRIEGEVTGDIQTIVDQSEVPVKPEAPAPGTVVEGVGVVNSEGLVVAEVGSSAVVNPNKRRPPPPKRKGRGIGKGRKKKVMFAPGEGADASIVHGATPSAENGPENKVGQDGLPISADQHGQEDDEDDGEDGDESDEGDESMVDAKTQDTPVAQSFEDSSEQQPTGTNVDQEKDIEMKDALPDPQHPEPEPSSTVPPPDTSAASQPEPIAQETDASASATPAPLAEQIQETTAEPHGSIEPSKEISSPREPFGGTTDSDEKIKEPEDTEPKEEKSDTTPTVDSAVEAAKQSPAPETQVPTAADNATNDTQPDSQPAKPEERTPALPSASPEEKLSVPTVSSEPPLQPESTTQEASQPSSNSHENEQSETLQTPENEDHTANTEAGQDSTDDKQDTDMGATANPPEQQSSLEESAPPSEKPASPAPAPPANDVEPNIEPSPETTNPPISAPDNSTPSAPEPEKPETEAEPSAPAPAESEPAPESEKVQTEGEPKPEPETTKEESDSNAAPAESTV
ncbi:uncharacterized protein N7469_005423 [Penicillium citrinum]|uniref:LYR family protein n=2 Tax=Penicillium TaxID=5073 RepID=A0A9W9P1J9_PENCI|nr:uncharacterized protein N7469_005423 [Penicillium citrinum]KAJ5233657.1 hypothetical protein N7469_005423 [Penicillium citrinum]KAJ5572871.1 hypothetical protein N7450_009855 [Penicillium hetheringtonii]